MARDIAGKVVVITGASSGIGRATALAFARRGANLVLAARDSDPLRQVAAECEQVGAPAIVVPTDVRDELAVNELARRAIEAFDAIDIWINNAAVYALGKLEEVPPDSFRDLYETNLFGVVNGCRAAIPHLRETRGVLINVASQSATMGIPLGSAYNSSKWAVRGLSDCLREELREDGVAVVTIMPASIDTALYDHAANYTGKAMKPMEPVYSPHHVAKVIVASARNPRPERTAGQVGYLVRLLKLLLPLSVFGRLLAAQTRKTHLLDRPAPRTNGNLDQPLPPFAVEGGWRAGWRDGRRREIERRRKAALATAAVGLCLAAVPVGMAMVTASQRRSAGFLGLRRRFSALFA
jgi:NAD(P)-dependent dehydrogenase (short-subunit alcohol dehydrogenase family)